MGFRLHWNGDQIAKRVERAAIRGVNKTTVQCAQEAKPPFPRHAEPRAKLYVFGNYARGIYAHNAVARGGKVVGLWGSHDTDYAIYLEHRYNNLRNTADAVYPGLPSNIREAYGKL